MDYSKYPEHREGNIHGYWNIFGKHMIPCTGDSNRDAGKAIDELLARCKELEKALAYIREECEDCKASSDPTASQCAICETGRVLKELDK